jgi:cytochrome c
MKFKSLKMSQIFNSLVALTMGFGLVQAQFSYPKCDDLKPTDFKMTEIFNKDGGAGAFDNSIAEPVQMELHGVKKGKALDHVDIYFVERLGGVKHFDAGTKKITSMGKINTLGKADNGLMGISLHPDFDNNKWMYLWYSPNKLLGDNRILRLSRFTVSPADQLDMPSEKIMIEIKGSKSDNWHSGGPMTFDSYGDLWITVGNNGPDLDPATCNVMSTTDSTASQEWGSSNTASMRGGILRIHPDNSDKGYSIPTGNFGDYWAKQWDAQGKTALAAEYRNPAKVLPEVYVKGDRSNYSVTVHPTKRWLAWAVVNYSSVNDEFNLVTHPVFAGYPYFHQNNLSTCTGKTPSVDAPKNNSPFNSGVTDLPPATPGAINNLVNVAMSGPIYAYDRSLDMPTKFPPHLDQSWINMSFQSNQMHISTLDTTKVTVLKTQRVDNGLFAAWKLRHPVQAKYGPDGSLYVLNYDGFYSTDNPAVFKVDYTGACQLPVSTRKTDLRNPNVDIKLSQEALSIHESGMHEFNLYDITGNLRIQKQGNQATDYSILELRKQFHLEKGIYSIQVKTLNGSFVQILSLL